MVIKALVKYQKKRKIKITSGKILSSGLQTGGFAWENATT